jgi:hypothetical protein
MIKMKNKSLKKEELLKLDKLYNSYYPESVKESIYSYSYEGNIVNDCLRNHAGKWNSELKNKYNINKKEFQTILNNLDKHQVSIVEKTRLYRGFKNNINMFYVSMKIHDNGYTSTSFDKRVAIEYADEEGSLLIIDAPKGTKGVYMRQYSQRPEEVEFLLPRNIELEVYKINKQTKEVFCRIKYL